MGREGYESILAEEIMELHSLGIDVKIKKAKQTDKEELIDDLKQSMIQDYRTAYSNSGTRCEDEAKATVSL
jgi:hypothetical protein